MPEGDTIHRAADRIQAAMAGAVIESAAVPAPRSPLHNRAEQIEGRTLERAYARGKHLIVEFSGGLALHSHLGMNGRWRVADAMEVPFGKPWLILRSANAVASQTGGQILRLVTSTRVRNDPRLACLGPDLLAADFDVADGARRLRRAGPGREIGEVLLDQNVVAGIGNAIRNGALFAAGISPWRPIRELEDEQLARTLEESRRIMQTALRVGRRPPSIYRAHRRGCPRCRGPVSVRGQGDDNRTAYWCPACQS